MNKDEKESSTKIAIPSLDSQDSLDGPVSPHFGESPTFTIVTLKNAEISQTEDLKNPNGNCFSIIDALTRKSVNVLLVANIGARPYLAAQSRGIDVRKIAADSTKKKAVESYIKGETAPFRGIDICPGKECH